MSASLLAGAGVAALRPRAAPAAAARRRAAAPCRAAAQKPADRAPLPDLALGVSGLLPPLLLDASAAHAIGREYGFVEGQIMSLLHPGFMFFLFGASVYGGYLGFQWQKTRLLGEQIRDLKKEAAAAAPAVAAADGEAAPPPPAPLQKEIAAMEAERKELVAQRYNEKHSNWGHLLLGLGVLMAVAGPVNTFLRTGKLFPGPHLYAGAAIVVLWAGAASLVPSMQRGNELSRSLHITFNLINVALFAWQIPTGLEIVGKVMQFTTLP